MYSNLLGIMIYRNILLHRNVMMLNSLLLAVMRGGTISCTMFVFPLPSFFITLACPCRGRSVFFKGMSYHYFCSLKTDGDFTVNFDFKKKVGGSSIKIRC
jgi:hypothetical protein